MQIATSKTRGAKALGVHWNTHSDMLHVSTPAQGLDKLSTKREIASAAVQVFDILGWFAPTVVWVKILLQKIWKLGLEWDELIPEHLAWKKWKHELQAVTEKGLPRCLYPNLGEV